MGRELVLLLGRLGAFILVVCVSCRAEYCGAGWFGELFADEDEGGDFEVDG